MKPSAIRLELVEWAKAKCAHSKRSPHGAKRNLGRSTQRKTRISLTLMRATLAELAVESGCQWLNWNVPE
jgi:hypothetical protein